MKIAKKVIGIISVVLFGVISLQSCAVGLGNTLTNNGEISGSAGIVVAIMMFISGILGIAVGESTGATITAACLYGVAGIVGMVNAGSYGDLMIWSVLSYIFAFIFVISILFTDKGKKED